MVDQVFASKDVESLWAPGEVLWPLGDHLGTVRDILDSVGNVVNHLRYDSFGPITSETNAAVDFLFAFTGRERDEESGLYYYRARYYDPEAGRFTSEDPIGFAAGDTNLVRFVSNLPTQLTDPSGLEPPLRVMDWRLGIPHFEETPNGLRRVNFNNRHWQPTPQPQPGSRGSKGCKGSPSCGGLFGPGQPQLQPGQPPPYQPGGPSDIPEKLEGRWQVSIVTDMEGSHAWIRFQNVDTGKVVTIGNFQFGYGARYGPDGRLLVAPVKSPGLQMNVDVPKDEGVLKGYYPSRKLPMILIDPPIYKDDTPTRYNWYYDNCATYARDAWYYYTKEFTGNGEWIWLPGPDNPRRIRNWIIQKNEEEAKK